MSNHQSLRYIVVEGAIGVGKTSLARRLAETFESDPLLESVDDNPFLERFYQNPKSAALATQLQFLFTRSQQVQALRQSDLFRPACVADFMLEKDRLFAQLTLDEHELKLYEQVYERVEIDAPAPDLVIYLQAPVEVLLKRIAQRGRRWEQRIDPHYLERLAEAYTRFFYHYDEAPLLIVNAAEIDLVNNDRDYQRLLQQIRATRSGRHYFNPVPIAF
ncbi:MAG: deoxynucleoside kinase [Gammaproteobacteria bacterium]